MYRETVMVQDVRGLHAVLATVIAVKARQFQSSVYLTNLENGYRAPAGSVLEILSMETARGTGILIEADGEDEEDAVKQLGKLVTSDAYMRHPTGD